MENVHIYMGYICALRTGYLPSPLTLIIGVYVKQAKRSMLSNAKLQGENIKRSGLLCSEKTVVVLVAVPRPSGFRVPFFSGGIYSQPSRHVYRALENNHIPLESPCRAECTRNLCISIFYMFTE